MTGRRIARTALVLISACLFAVAALIAAVVWLLTAGRCAWLLTFVFVVGAAALLLAERRRYRPGHQPHRNGGRR